MSSSATPFDLASALATAILDVFQTMIPLEVAAEPPLAEGSADIQAYLAAMIGLSGDLEGLLTIHCPAEVGAAIAGAMLGLPPEEVGADVKDALGEVANMVAGGLKVTLAAASVAIELAIPSIITGSGYRITAPDGTRRTLVPFATPAGRFWVEFKYRRAL